MVASTHWLARARAWRCSSAAATPSTRRSRPGFVLQVVEPHLNGPGGDVPAIVCPPSATRRRHLRPGAGAGRGDDRALRRLGLDLVPGTGLLAAVVPGRVRRLDADAARLRDLGAARRAWRSRSATPRDGYPLVPGDPRGDRAASRSCSATSGRPRRRSTCRRPRAPGERLRNPALADTYERHRARRRGGDARARGGSTPRATPGTAAGSPRRSTLRSRHRGRWTRAAAPRGLLARRRPRGLAATLEAPVTLDYRGYTMCKTGPWGQGPVFLQQLALLDGLRPRRRWARAPSYVHTVVECAKLAFADREAWYGDPASPTCRSTRC